MTLALGVAYAIIAGAWYWSYRNGPFAQDDPGLLSFLQDPSRSWIDRMTGTDANRLRPVTNLGYMFIHAIAGNAFVGWWLFNMLLLGTLAALSALLVMRISRSTVLGVAVGLLITTSRFSEYQAVTATGVVEALANILFVVVVGGLIMYYAQRRPAGLIISAVAFLLLVFTYERYQLVAVALIAIVWFLPDLSRRARIGWSSIFLAPVLLLNAVKMLVFGMPLLVGTGTATEVGFSGDTTWAHVVSAGAQLFGINWGPAYVVGTPFTDMTAPMQVAGFLLAALTVLVFLSPAERAIADSTAARGALRRVVMLCLIGLMGVSLLVPIVITIRLDQRWLVTLSVLMLGCIAYLARRALLGGPIRRVVTWTLLSAFTFLTLVMNVQYRGAMDNLHFISSKASTEGLITQLTPAWIKAGKAPLYVVDSAGNPGYEPSFNMVMQANTDEGTRSVHTVTSLADVPRDPRNLAAFFVPGGTGTLERIDAPTQGVPPLITDGEIYPDGWVGEQFSAAVTDANCKAVLIRVEPSLWGANIFTVSSNFGFGTRRALERQVLNLRVAVPGPGAIVTVRFSRTWVPQTINAGDDMRRLATHARVRCAP